MCYSDLPYLYTGRGFAELNWPYSDDAQVRAATTSMEYPVGISYWAWGTAWVTHWLSGSPDLDASATTCARTQLFADQDVARGGPGSSSRSTRWASPPLALLAAWFLAGVNRAPPWDAVFFAPRRRWP